MKKEELRIGNWYTSVKFKVPVKCDLSDLYNLCANSDGATDHPPIDEMFEPILITEELVERLGFLNDWGDKWSIDKGEFMQIEKVKEGWIKLADGYYHDGKSFKYIHELQNLYYAHTKEELVLAVAP